ncbi:MAG TPA: hypothetical protein VFI12_02405, partial [Thermomicrobiales bacterium]|nr:hypothetical protein [Thermomicrobiales bacterium]
VGCDAPSDLPIAVFLRDLDVTGKIEGREQDGRSPATAFPAIDWRARPGPRWRRVIDRHGRD